MFRFMQGPLEGIKLLVYDSLNYTWTNQGGKQITLSAPTYIDSVMSSIQKLLEDETVFPTNSSIALVFPIYYD